MFIRTRFRTRDINLPAWGNHPPRATIPLGELDRYQSSGQLGLFVAVWGGGEAMGVREKTEKPKGREPPVQKKIF